MTQSLVITPIADLLTTIEIPSFGSRVQAGFPSPAFDYSEDPIDFNKLLINDKEATFVVKVNGTSMIDAHVVPGSLLIVDKSIIPNSGDIVVAVIYGEFTVKYYKVENGLIWLVPANKDYQPMQINECQDFQIWGVVIRILINPRIHSLQDVRPCRL